MAFRYSRQVAYYTLWIAGTLVCALILILLFRTFLNSIGIDPDGMYMNSYWQEHSGIMLAIVISGAIAIVVISFLFPFRIALKVTDKKGNAIFGSEKVCFEFGSKNVSIPYSDIRKITFATVQVRRGGGPHLYRLKIKTNRSRYFIQCSFREAWQCRRKKTQPTIWALCNRLSSETGIEIKQASNVRG